MATPKQTDPQFKLRLTPELKRSIEQGAARNNRSMNAEIIARLEGAEEYDEYGNVSLPMPKDLWSRIIQEAHDHDVRPTSLVVEALEKAFPPPALTIGNLVDSLRRSLTTYPPASAVELQEIEEFLNVADRVFENNPDAANRIFAVKPDKE